MGTCCAGEAPQDVSNRARGKSGGKAADGEEEEKESLMLTPWGKKYGKKSGNSFTAAPSEFEGVVDGIRIFGSKDCVNYIQLRHSGKWQTKHGNSQTNKTKSATSAPMMNEIVFDDGEYVFQMIIKYSKSSKNISYLSFKTNFNSIIDNCMTEKERNRALEGSGSGKKQITKTEPSSQDDLKLVNVRGSYDDNGITHIQSKWSLTEDSISSMNPPQWGKPYGIMSCDSVDDDKTGDEEDAKGNDDNNNNNNSSTMFGQMGVYGDISKELTGIRLYGKDIVKAIQFNVNDEWQERYGCMDSLDMIKQEYTLATDRDEYFNKIQFNFNDENNSFEYLQFSTNLRKTVEMGMGDLSSRRKKSIMENGVLSLKNINNAKIDDKDKDKDKPNGKKSCLVDIRGTANSNHVTGLQFLWDFVNE